MTWTLCERVGKTVCSYYRSYSVINPDPPGVVDWPCWYGMGGRFLPYEHFFFYLTPDQFDMCRQFQSYLLSACKINPKFTQMRTVAWIHLKVTQFDVYCLQMRDFFLSYYVS